MLIETTIYFLPLFSVPSKDESRDASLSHSPLVPSTSLSLVLFPSLSNPSPLNHFNHSASHLLPSTCLPPPRRRFPVQLGHPGPTQRPRLVVRALVPTELFWISQVGDLGLEGSGDEGELSSSGSTHASEETFFSCSSESSEDEFGGSGGLERRGTSRGGKREWVGGRGVGEERRKNVSFWKERRKGRGRERKSRNEHRGWKGWGR